MKPLLNQYGRNVKRYFLPSWGGDYTKLADKLAQMPERIGPKVQKRLYIAEWRVFRRLTQEQLAARLGCSDVTVSRWETRMRQPDLNAQEAIAEALDIEVVDLRRDPHRPSADALLRDQEPEVVDQAIRLIQAIRR